jgi:hypothetical protein
VADLIMTDMDGLTLRQAVRARWPSCGFVLLSAHDALEALEDVPRVAKPARLEQVQAAISVAR